MAYYFWNDRSTDDCYDMARCYWSHPKQRTDPRPYWRRRYKLTSKRVLFGSLATPFSMPHHESRLQTNRGLQSFEATKASQICNEKLRAKFFEYTQAQVGETVGESVLALGIITRRSKVLSNLASKISLRDPRGVDAIFRANLAGYRGLNVRSSSRPIERARKILATWSSRAPQSAHYTADAWLLYSLVAEPTMTDILNAVNIIAKDRPKGRRLTVSHQMAPYEWLHQFGSPASPPAAYTFERIYSTECRFRLSSYMEVNNPYAARANQLGLGSVNKVLWQLFPASFLVDALLPVSAFLNQWAAFEGITLRRTYRSVMLKGEGRYRRRYGSNANTYTMVLATSSIVAFERSTAGNPPWQWYIRIPELHWKSAANAFALALSTFRRTFDRVNIN